MTMQKGIPAYIPTVKNVNRIEVQGPWKTKSGGDLHLLLSFPYRPLQQYLRPSSDEASRMQQDLRGLRLFMIDNLPQDARGAQEFHRLRQEMIWTRDCCLEIECEDLRKNKTTFALQEYQGISIPPFIFYSYRVTKEGSMLVLANTIALPESPETKDSYEYETFQKLQKMLEKRNTTEKLQE